MMHAIRFSNFIFSHLALNPPAQKYPNTDNVLCATPAFCIDSAKTGDCDLYADDELLLRYRASEDDTLSLINEGFGTQYISWPIRFGLDPNIYTLLSRWLYAAVQDESLDKLTEEYFGALVPPPGSSGGGGGSDNTASSGAAACVTAQLVGSTMLMAVVISSLAFY
jgi:ABC-type amino acid transport substrate-binding protein